MSPDKVRRARRQRGVSLTPQRRPREVDRVFHVVCEGEVTEYDYFTMINREFRSRGFWLDFPPERERRKGLSPRQVVDRALTAAAERQVEAVWALFDRDQHTQIPEAFDDVKDHPKVRIAFSNPSFDLWLLLHFQPYTPQTGGSSRYVHTTLRSNPSFAGFGDHDKRITEGRATALVSGIETAVKNARRLVDACPAAECSARNGHVSSCNPLDRDPSTDMYLLIEALGLVPRSR